MNGAHIHLLLNHFPIILPIAGLIILLAGMFIRSEHIIRTAYAIFIAAAITAAMAFFTGEGAEEMIEHMQGVSHDLIHEHEEHAEGFAIISYVLGITSLAALWGSIKQKPVSVFARYALILICLIGLFFGAQTGNSGGLIRHPEIGNGAAQPSEHQGH